MNDDINKVLATKRAWRKSDGDRRLKDGSHEDRKLTADCIRSGRAMEVRQNDFEKKAEFSAFIVAVCILGAVVMLIIFTHK